MTSNRKKRLVDNEGVTTRDAKNLQAELFTICHQAIQQAREEEKITPALISSIHKVVSDSGVQVGAAAADMDHPIWKVVDELEDLNFLQA